MKKVLFLEKDCLCISIPNGAFSDKSLNIITYTGKQADIGIMQPDRSFAIMTETEFAIKTLNEGKGILFDGSIYFSLSSFKSSKYYKRFNKAYNEFLSNLTELELSIYRSLNEVHDFYKVLSMIELYFLGVYSYELTIQKIEAYMRKAEAVAIFEELGQQVAG